MERNMLDWEILMAAGSSSLRACQIYSTMHSTCTGITVKILQQVPSRECKVRINSSNIYGSVCIWQYCRRSYITIIEEGLDPSQPDEAKMVHERARRKLGPEDLDQIETGASRK